MNCNGWSFRTITLAQRSMESIVNKRKPSPTLTLIGFGGRFPVLRTNYRQTHLSLLVDVRMVDFRFEIYFRRLERVLRWEIDFYFERTFVIRSVILQQQQRQPLRQSPAFVVRRFAVASDRHNVNDTYGHYESLPCQDIRLVHLDIPKGLQS